jgi:hypothetical protein
LKSTATAIARKINGNSIPGVSDVSGIPSIVVGGGDGLGVDSEISDDADLETGCPLNFFVVGIVFCISGKIFSSIIRFPSSSLPFSNIDILQFPSLIFSGVISLI